MTIDSVSQCPYCLCRVKPRNRARHLLDRCPELLRKRRDKGKQLSDVMLRRADSCPTSKIEDPEDSEVQTRPSKELVLV